MTVLATQNVAYRRFNGYTDPRYPEGHWWGSGVVTGDLTGGLMVMTLHFNAGSTALSSRIYSLEQIAVYSGAVASSTAVLEVFNLGGPENSPVGMRRIIRFQTALVAGFGAAMQGEAYNFLPMFLGAQQDASQTSQVAISSPNVDGVSQTFEAEGYWWGARSILAEGGPQRPPTGIYPA